MASQNLTSMIGNSPEFNVLISRIRVVAPASSPVLIDGETGAGKEPAALAIRSLSPRANLPLIRLDCITVPPESLEQELIARLHQADRATLLIDEVTELPPDAQAALTRAIQQQELPLPGSESPVKIDVRVLATTNRNLEQAVREGHFRSDLYYCLMASQVRVPALRQRRQDIPLLTEHFLKLHARRLGRPAPHVPERSMEHLLAYDWPGNIRELKHALFRSALLQHEEVDFSLQPSGEAAEASGPVTLQEAERRHVERTLNARNWIIEGPRGAAAVLNLPPSTLRSLMKRLGIRRAPKSLPH